MSGASATGGALVTGAAGFVGANLLRRLLADGHRTIAAIPPGGERWRFDGVEGHLVREVDLTEPGVAHGLLQEVAPRWVFHLAAHGAYSWQRDAARIIATNVLATQGLLKAARAARCEAVVLAGTSSEYGFKDHAPAETEALEPNSVYSASKAAATMLAMLAGADGGPAVTVLRLYSAYGAFEDPRRLIPRLLSLGLRGELPPLVDPSTARDFIAVEDAVDAFIVAAEGSRPGSGAIYNVGTGIQTTIGELVEIVRVELGITAEPDWGSAPARAWDTSTWFADPRAIRAGLGWEAATDLRTGIARTIGWLRAHPEHWNRYGVSA